MKRITVIVILLFYLASVIIVTDSAHHCGGKITSVSLNLLNHGQKCSCNKKNIENCCKNETKPKKIKDEQRRAHSLTIKISQTRSHQSDLNDIFACRFSHLLTSIAFSHFTNSPNKSEWRIYIQNGVLRI